MALVTSWGLSFTRSVSFKSVSILKPSLSLNCALLPPSPPTGQVVKVKPFPLMGLLPERNLSQYYRYSGSLTTPPCTQAVLWTIYQVPVLISWSQVLPPSPNTYHSSFNLWRIPVTLQPWLLLFFLAARSVHLSDLLHRRGCRASDAPAQQLQAQPRPLQPRCIRLQRRRAAQRRRRTPPLVGHVTAYGSLRRFTASTLDSRNLKDWRWTHIPGGGFLIEGWWGFGEGLWFYILPQNLPEWKRPKQTVN